MPKKIKTILSLISDAAKKYKKDDPVRLAGTTAYFTIFAIAPIILIIISVTGLVVNEQNMSQKIYTELNSLIGPDGSTFIKNIVQNYQDKESNLIGTIIGIVTFLITSTTFFKVLQNALNFIWRIRVKPKHNFLKALVDRLLSFGLILSLGFIFLVSLLVDAGLAFLKDYFASTLPVFTLTLFNIINYIVAFVIITLIFAIIYKFLPDAKIKWKVTWVGALITATLFSIGKYAIGFAIANTNIGFMYGAAGSVIIFLLWVFYSSLILFFGAEITQQYAEYFSHEIKPKSYAVKIKISEVDE